MQIKGKIEKKFIQWVLIAKGVGIILVVIGHFSPESSPAYWNVVNKMIYTFHMPLFFILSGYLFHSGRYSYPELLKAKTRRLLLPFVTIAGTFLLIKLTAAQVVTLEYPVSLSSIQALLTNPVRSYMPLLWFIHALYLIFVIYPLARLIMSDEIMILVLLAFNTVSGSHIWVFGSVLAYMPFFLFGIVLREKRGFSRLIMKKGWLPLLAPLGLFFLMYRFFLPACESTGFEYLVRILLGITGSILVINFSRALSLHTADKTGVLGTLGYYSMSIYLFHTLFESTVRIGFAKISKYFQVPFEPVALIAVFCGLLFPFILEKYVLRRYSLTRKFVLGLS